MSALTSSLALVTCKEPLRVSIANHLRTLLQAAASSAAASAGAGGAAAAGAVIGAGGVLDAALLDATVNQVAADNLEVSCGMIEKSAAERAVREIDALVRFFFFGRCWISMVSCMLCQISWRVGLCMVVSQKSYFIFLPVFVSPLDLSHVFYVI